MIHIFCKNVTSIFGISHVFRFGKYTLHNDISATHKLSYIQYFKELYMKAYVKHNGMCTWIVNVLSFKEGKLSANQLWIYPEKTCSVSVVRSYLLTNVHFMFVFEFELIMFHFLGYIYISSCSQRFHSISDAVLFQ